MLPFDTIDRPEIPISVVCGLIAAQFPQWAGLPVKPVVQSGWDNRTFHLGDRMLVRMPSAERYARAVEKEQKWLPKLSAHLPASIPEPLAMGRPTDAYPFHWSIYRWIEGQTSDTLGIDELPAIAEEIAGFLKALYKIDTTGAPLAGPPFFRGTPPVVYDRETRQTLEKLKDIVDVKACLSVWQNALASKWDKAPVWFHGDFSPQNILVKNGKLTGVIDFGSCRVGDPACDLVISWTLLDQGSRKIFRDSLGLDADCWARARGWGLWKALITLAPLADKSNKEALRQKTIIHHIISDHQSEYGN